MGRGDFLDDFEGSALDTAVFDFPDKAASSPPDHVPELAVDYVRGRPLSDGVN